MKNEKNRSIEIEERIEKIEILLNEIKKLKDKETGEANEGREDKNKKGKSEELKELEDDKKIIKNVLKNPWFYFSIIASIIIILFIFKTSFFNPLGNTEVINPPQDNIPAEKFEVSVDDDAFLGNENAPVTIIEFSDYQCPFCARFYSNTLPLLKKEYIDTGKVKIIFRDFPLNFHQDSQKAAEATESARELGGNDAFWKMHDKIFENQQAISEQELVKYSKEIGLNEDKFKEILISNKYEDEVQGDLKDGQEAGVQGTPTFFINGRILVGAQPFSEFKKIIDEELQ